MNTHRQKVITHEDRVAASQALAKALAHADAGQHIFAKQQAEHLVEMLKRIGVL